MAAAIGLSEDGTLLVPVDGARFELAPTMRVDDVTLVRKAEHHITVFHEGIGTVLRRAIERVPALGPAFDELVASADFGWTMPSPQRRWRLHRDHPDGLQTVVVEIDAPGIAPFFAACDERLGALAGNVELPAWQPPPPHVTLYTSDPHGKAGIGLRSLADLRDAERRALAGDRSGLRAFPLRSPDQIEQNAS